MTGPMPLSGAFKGLSYKGQFGTGAGEFAKLAAGIAQGAREEQERKRKVALEEALQRLREKQEERETQRLDLERNRFAFEQTKEQGRAAEATRDFGETQRVNDLEEKNRLRDDERDSKTLEETTRHNKATEANARSRIEKIGSSEDGRDWVVKETVSGQVFRMNKLTGRMVPFTQPSGSETSTPDAAGAPVFGAGARANESEKSAAGAYDLLQKNFDMLKGHMGKQDAQGNYKVTYEPPNPLEQIALDGTKVSGNAPWTSVYRSASNALVNNQYQLVQNAVDAITADVTKMKTGAQMSEAEAQRLLGIIRSISGDKPEVVVQKLQQVQNILDSERIKMGRAAPGMPGREALQPGSSPAPAPVAPSRPDVSDLKKKYGLE